jgi:hypothetical protein
MYKKTVVLGISMTWEEHGGARDCSRARMLQNRDGRGSEAELVGVLAGGDS